MSGAVRMLADTRCLLGECPVWDPVRRRFGWLDLAEGVLHEASPAGEHSWQRLPLDPPLGGLVRTPIGVAVVHGGGLASADGQVLLDLSLSTGGAHPNDAKIDRSGGLWIATADVAEADATGRLLRVADGRVFTAAGPMVVGNGPAFSPDGVTVYWCDTLAGRLLAAPVDGSATPRLLLEIAPEDGYPDGLTVAADGSLFVALWGGAAVLRVTPGGRVLDRVDVPAPLVTSVAFGGPQLDLLLVTTARWDLDDGVLARFPLSGGAFVWEGDAVGLPERAWRP